MEGQTQGPAPTGYSHNRLHFSLPDGEALRCVNKKALRYRYRRAFSAVWRSRNYFSSSALKRPLRNFQALSTSFCDIAINWSAMVGLVIFSIR